MASGIYKIVGPNGIYIGSAKDINRRYSVHLTQLRSNKHHSAYLQRAYNKYGEDSFRFEVVEYIDDAKYLLVREQYWLDWLFDNNPRTSIYNVLRYAGNSLGRKATEETKRKLSEKRKQRATKESTRAKMSDARKGNKHLLGYKFSDDGLDNVARGLSGGKSYTIISPDGTVYSNVYNITGFARKHDIPVTCLKRAITGAKPEYKGWKGYLND